MLQTVSEATAGPDIWHYLIIVLGALGAWLLVAGPLYQAALELSEEGLDRDAFASSTSAVPDPEHVSQWWWLLPPVAYVKQRRRRQAYREAVMDALGPEQLKQSVSFFNKANGWFIVGAGGLLIAAKETYEVVELFEWPLWLFWILIAAMGFLCVGNLMLRMSTSRRMLEKIEGQSAEKALPAS